MNITTPWEVDLDGRIDEGDGYVLAEYVGTAKRQLDGTYRVLAKLPRRDGYSALCVVEVKLTFE